MKHNKFLLTGLRQVLRRFDENGRFSRQGHWHMAIGGYDLLWELYYDGMPVLDCTDHGWNNHLLSIVNEYGHSNIMDVITVVKQEYSDAKYDVSTEYAIVDEVGKSCIPFNLRIIQTFKSKEEARAAYHDGITKGKSWSFWSMTFVNGKKSEADWDILDCFDWAA